MVQPGECDLHAILYMANVTTFLNRLRQCKVGPSGQVSKLTTILSALRMVVGMIPEVGASENEQQIVIRAKIIETKCLIKTLCKEAQTLRAQKRDLYNGDTKEREAVLAFLADDRIVETYISK